MPANDDDVGGGLREVKVLESPDMYYSDCATAAAAATQKSKSFGP